MTIESPTGLVELRTGRPEVHRSAARAAVVTPVGVHVVVGDAMWDPATLTFRARIADTTVDAVAKLQTILEHARTATSLHLDNGTIAYVHGLIRELRRPRPGWWELELTFQPRALVGVSGTGALVTIAGDEIVTIPGGAPVTVEV